VSARATTTPSIAIQENLSMNTRHLLRPLAALAVAATLAGCTVGTTSPRRAL
jgi:hypothetical protein